MPSPSWHLWSASHNVHAECSNRVRWEQEFARPPHYYWAKAAKHFSGSNFLGPLRTSREFLRLFFSFMRVFLSPPTTPSFSSANFSQCSEPPTAERWRIKDNSVLPVALCCDWYLRLLINKRNHQKATIDLPPNTTWLSCSQRANVFYSCACVTASHPALAPCEVFCLIWEHYCLEL